MGRRPFNKPATTYTQQVALLEQRGMSIPDPEDAAFWLEHLNYYRLGAYWLPYEADHESLQFKVGTSFNDVLALYRFDRELRLLVLDAIERVEVSVRSRWAYELAHRHGPHGHLDSTLFKSTERWHKDSANLHEAVRRSDEVFIKHIQRTYRETLPPVWAVCEVMTLGLLSKYYDNLKPAKTRKAIANTYAMPHELMASWLRHLTQIRNICAHHARLWNRDLIITPMRPTKGPNSLVNAFSASRRLYNTLLILPYWMDCIAPGHSWRQRLKDLLATCPYNLNAMGFPSDWASHALWQS
jgi:abortive infection bacteriophage resistance protein